VAPTTLTRIWSDGRTALGAWLFLRDPFGAELVGRAGFDYVCIDLQHGLGELSDALALLQALSGSEASPIVRVPWNEPGIIGRVLDLGATGVIIPMVNTADDARRAVAACRYAPAGARSFGPVRAGVVGGPGYLASADAVVACIVMIETAEAIEHLDEILAVPGITAVYIGPSDLSLTYGLPPAPDNPGEVFDGALARVLAACERHGVVPGIHATAALAPKRIAAGFRMVTVANDVGALVAGIQRDLASVRDTGPAATAY